MSDQEPSAEAPRPPDSKAFGNLLQGLASEMNLLGHDFAAAQGLHATDVQALLAIMRGSTGAAPGPVTPSRLREELALTSGAVTAVLDRLERAGHIRRSRDAADRRQVQVHYNPGASRMAAAWFAPVAACTDAVAAEFSPDELRTVARFLGRMTTGLEGLRRSRREDASDGTAHGGGAQGGPGRGGAQAGPDSEPPIRI